MPRPKPPTFDHPPTSLPHDHFLVQLGPPLGSNNFRSTDPTGTDRLVELSSKLRTRGSVLVARRDFGIIKLFPPDPSNKDKEEKLSGEIIKVLSGKEVRDYKRGKEWPEGFGEPEPVVSPTANDEEAESVSGDEDDYEYEVDDDEEEDGEEEIAEEDTKAPSSNDKP